MELNAVHHVAIITSDYQKSKTFYTEVLGLEIIRENYRKERESYKLDLKIGSNQIELFSFPNAPARVNGPEAVGLRHLCFEVANVDEVKRSLEKKGIDVEEVRVDSYTAKRYTFFKDPDGLPLELYEQ
ncbi:SMU1112c/YaeR family gloxylase I-like metalloprotein [Alkalibacterium olivapovliticus]|uniref:Glyoxylase I family protein n=1 Tax=Alkalibacterium olivapovliticus TaxID=99907 RepID=A0A2T0W602_9LACT|nr:VOC family protein [Alkalibacterium olivapovliticus]PRY82141.1 glyoxylase I family protein [Alkalibacterium olivapovliticus]